MLHTENDIKAMIKQLEKRREFFSNLEIENEKQKKKVEKIINNINKSIDTLQNSEL